MSFMFGGKGHATKPEYTGIQLQTSSSTAALIIAWGANRIGPNIIWYGDFKSHKQKQKAGKGGGGSATSYTYSASCMFALCEGGPDGISGIGKVWKDQDTSSSLSSLGMTLFSGTPEQDPWGYLSSNHPDQAYNYPNVAYLAVANYDLGTSASLPNHSFEVKSQRVGSGWTGGDDADCALVIQDFLTYPAYGVLIPDSAIDADQLLSTANATTTGDASYQTYCRAMGFGLSPALSDQEQAADTLDRWTKLTNTAVVWTGYCLRFVPYCYTETDGNGVKFVPNTTAQYSLNDDDYIGPTDPLQISRDDPANCKNQLRLIYKNRSNDYNTVPATWKDQGLIEQYGLQTDSDFQADEVCVATMAQKAVTLYGKRGAYIRNHYTFTLGVAHCLLEPMDVVEVVDPQLGIVPVQITKMTEGDEEGQIEFEADEVAIGVDNPASHVPPTNSGYAQNTGVDPGDVNTPVILEPPVALAGSPQVWAAVSGGSDWGGCQVYVSADGGTTYQNIGSITSGARQGTLSAALAAYAGDNPDTTNTASVNLTESRGDLQSVSDTEASNAATLCYTDGEYFSFETATLTATSKYDLTGLYRGLYGSTAGAHASGSQFARLDDNVFEYDLPEDYVGIALKFKFPSFNIFGSGLQDLSDIDEYDYTPNGSAFGVPPDAPTAVSGLGGTLSNKVTWTPATTGDAATGFKIVAGLGADVAFADCSVVGSVQNANVFIHAGLGVSEEWTYYVVAYNGKGDSDPSPGENLTTSDEGGGGSLEVDQDGTPVVATATKLNFSGATVTDGGDGVANIAITGGGGGGNAMSPQVVNQAGFVQNGSTFTLPFTPTVGNTLICLGTHWSNGPTPGTGWTEIYVNNGSNYDGVLCYSKVVSTDDVTAGTVTPFVYGNGGCSVAIFEVSQTLYVARGLLQYFKEANNTGGTLHMGCPNSGLFVGCFVQCSSTDGPSSVTGATSYPLATGTTSNQSPRAVSPFSHRVVAAGVDDVTVAYAATHINHAIAIALPDIGGALTPWDFDPPKASDFSDLLGSVPPTVSDDEDTGMVVDLGVPASGNVCRLAAQELPAGDWEITARLDPLSLFINYAYSGVFLYDSVSGKLVSLGKYYSSGNSSVTITNWGSLTSFSSDAVSYSGQYDTIKWFRIKGSTVPSTDQVLCFGSNRGNSVNTIDIGTQLQTYSGNNGSGVLNEGAGGASSATVSYATAGSGNYQAAIQVKSVDGSTNPVLRGSAIAYVNNASSVVVALPAGSAAGDMCVAFAGHGYKVDTPSGWTSLDNEVGTQFNGAAFYKLLSAGDITAGSITIAFDGTYYGVAALAVYEGGTGGVTFVSSSRNGTGSSSVVLQISTLKFSVGDGKNWIPLTTPASYNSPTHVGIGGAYNRTGDDGRMYVTCSYWQQSWV